MLRLGHVRADGRTRLAGGICPAAHGGGTAYAAPFHSFHRLSTARNPLENQGLRRMFSTSCAKNKVIHSLFTQLETWLCEGAGDKLGETLGPHLRPRRNPAPENLRVLPGAGGTGAALPAGRPGGGNPRGKAAGFRGGAPAHGGAPALPAFSSGRRNPPAPAGAPCCTRPFPSRIWRLCAPCRRMPGGSPSRSRRRRGYPGSSSPPRRRRSCARRTCCAFTPVPWAGACWPVPWSSGSGASTSASPMKRKPCSRA